ncbi:hypothetical protein [Paraburkholderia sp. BL10I2N1]|uniref:hypothetical protein n=1 Tax=Paraburkholderia sp. BL10I2N1 TaxID=1938796 RepID=UPI001061D8E7|nr:hypothetical protein [Paraburkholderia sp. BL10I2N1]
MPILLHKYWPRNNYIALDPSSFSPSRTYPHGGTSVLCQAAKDFYDGKTADLIAASMRGHGLITTEVKLARRARQDTQVA